MAVEYTCCETGFFIRILIVIVLVLFAGLMSGLTLGLMSLSLVELEVLAKSGSPTDRKHAAKILPVVKRQHLLLCTLLISNAAAMEILDFLLGKQHRALFRRAELQTLVDLHGNEAGKGGELTRDETMIIAGALQLTEKTARDVMTPITETFAIELNSKLDRDLMDLIIEKGHSRVPVYYEKPSNIIGLILVKSLLTINPENEMPVKNITMRKIPRVSETMPLYDLLNEFQKGHSHMAAVVKNFGGSDLSANENSTKVGEVRVDVYGKTHSRQMSLKSKGSFNKFKSLPSEESTSTKGNRWSNGFHSEVLQINDEPLQNLSLEGEAVGIITLEDVIEELLQEEIYDETDHHDDS